MTHNPNRRTFFSSLRNMRVTPEAEFSDPSKEDVHETLCDKESTQTVISTPLHVPVGDDNLDVPESDARIDVEAETEGENSIPQKGSTGLWGHKDLTQKTSRIRIILLILLVFFGYAIALFVNSVAGRFVRPRFNLPEPENGQDPLARLGVVVYVLDPTYLIALFRGVSAACLIAFMILRKDTPWHVAAKAEKMDEYRTEKLEVNGILVNPYLLTPKLLVATLMGMCSAGGYMFIMSLTSRSGSATWSAMSGLYVVFPCAYGLVFKGEARTARKIIGIVLCVAASILLSLGKQQEIQEDDGAAEVSWIQTAILFFMAIFCWGACDAMAAYIGRSLHTFYVVIFTGVGFMVVSYASSLASFIAVAMHSVVDELAPPGTEDHTADDAFMGQGWGYFLVFLAQLGGVAGWYGSVLLGKLSEASAFLPITSLYTIFSSLLAVAILRESLGALGWSGIGLAVVGMLAIATS